jgi:hypothetical protein
MSISAGECTYQPLTKVMRKGSVGVGAVVEQQPSVRRENQREQFISFGTVDCITELFSQAARINHFG